MKGTCNVLRPQDSKTREKKQITGLWDFCFDPENKGINEKWYSNKLPNAVRMAVSTSFNDIFTEKSIKNFVGAVWYQTLLKIPAGWGKGRIYLYFESVTHNATVWLNDIEVASHKGGYTPFEADITDYVKAGDMVRITVRADNILTFQTIPPGNIVKTRSGKKQSYWHDFFNYSGIHRPVWLCYTPESYIEDITVTTDYEGNVGIVNYKVVQKSEGKLDVKIMIRDAENKEVATGEGEEGVINIPDVHLWAPGDGYLYNAEFCLYNGEELVDSYVLRVGVRTVEISGSQFLINGKPFYFKGFGKHEDLEIIGKGHNDAYMLHDFELLKWIGANSFRTTHYPYSEDILDYADEQGIVIIDETPAVGLNLVSGGIFPGEDMTTYSPDTINDKTQAAHANAIKELINRDKNHPSVVLWSIANEPESQTDAAAEYFEPLFEVARKADPSRPVGFVNMALATYGKCKVSQFADVIMINRYYGWYSEVNDLESAEIVLREELEGWAKENKPIIITEYGTDTLIGLTSVVSSPWTEEYQIEYLKMYHRVFDQIDAVVGEHVWNFADFATVPGITRVGGNKKGVFTRNRKPKMAAYELRKRWRGN
ncbi:MAG: beta-glucuronidase [Clostridiaceae bacterium]|nr:beta-glucuronidase [Clostridiaceae bacterium]